MPCGKHRCNWHINYVVRYQSDRSDDVLGTLMKNVVSRCNGAIYLLLMYISRIWSVSHSIAGCRPSPVNAFVARMCQGLFCIRSSPNPATSFTVVKESGRSILFARKRMGSLRPETFTSLSIAPNLLFKKLQIARYIRRTLDSLSDFFFPILFFTQGLVLLLESYYRILLYLPRRDVAGACPVLLSQQLIAVYRCCRLWRWFRGNLYNNAPIMVYGGRGPTYQMRWNWCS